jgi:twitching motility protein PilT
MQTAKKQGMILLNDALLDLVRRKQITPEEAWLKSVDKSGITSPLRAAGFEPPAPGSHPA